MKPPLFPQRLLRRWAACKDFFAGMRLSLRHKSTLEQFTKGSQAEQNAIDIFKGEWASAFPERLHVKAGQSRLYCDPRLQWFASQTSLTGKRVLELGPLEGGHTFQLLEAGAGSVTGIESNQRSFLKCLITKELLGLHSAHFLCADFLDYLEQHPDEQYDCCVASGVLYHMREPLRMLGLCSQHADELFLWTHYYDADLLGHAVHQQYRFGPPQDCEWQGFTTQGYRRSYGAQIWNPLHLGSDGAYSVWLPRSAILDALRYFGFDEIIIGHEDQCNAAGPAFSLVARKRS